MLGFLRWLRVVGTRYLLFGMDEVVIFSFYVPMKLRDLDCRKNVCSLRNGVQIRSK